MKKPSKGQAAENNFEAALAQLESLSPEQLKVLVARAIQKLPEEDRKTVVESTAASVSLELTKSDKLDPSNASQILEALHKVFEKTATIDDLDRLDVFVRKERRSILEKIPKEERKLTTFRDGTFTYSKVSYSEKYINNSVYWYAEYGENGKRHTKYVGNKLPKDVDPSKDSVSFYNPEKRKKRLVSK